jgi:protein-S-isoprenylcysteine O-methyltransferase Ste14
VKGIYAVMAILWFSWGQMCFTDPIRPEIVEWVRYLGLGGFVAGIALFVVSHLGLKGFRGGRGLVTGGIYSKIRNPMYLGFIIWLVGFPVYTRSLVTLLTSVLWISFILYWKVLEERKLQKEFDEYSEYKKKTWF